MAVAWEHREEMDGVRDKALVWLLLRKTQHEFCVKCITEFSRYDATPLPLDNLSFLGTVSHRSPAVSRRLDSILSVCNLDSGSRRKRKDLLSVCANCILVSNAVLLLHKDLGSYTGKKPACVRFNVHMLASLYAFRSLNAMFFSISVITDQKRKYV